MVEIDFGLIRASAPVALNLQHGVSLELWGDGGDVGSSRLFEVHVPARPALHAHRYGDVLPGDSLLQSAALSHGVLPWILVRCVWMDDDSVRNVRWHFVVFRVARTRTTGTIPGPGSNTTNHSECKLHWTPFRYHCWRIYRARVFLLVYRSSYPFPNRPTEHKRLLKKHSWYHCTDPVFFVALGLTCIGAGYSYVYGTGGDEDGNEGGGFLGFGTRSGWQRVQQDEEAGNRTEMKVVNGVLVRQTS